MKTTTELWAWEDCEDFLLACICCGEVFSSWEAREICEECEEQRLIKSLVSKPGLEEVEFGTD